MLSRAYVGRHLNMVSICLFLLLFAAIHVFRPSFMYNNDGSLRDFGVGFSKKTVVPAWLVTIILAMGSYLAVLYYVNAQRFY